MMSPMTRAFVITPICPHTLSFRPLVLPDSCSITVVVPQSSRAEAAVRFDGRNANTLHRGDKVTTVGLVFIQSCCVDEYADLASYVFRW